MRLFSFRNFRIFLLLLLLSSVAIYLQDQRLVTQGWFRTLNVVIYPINPDKSQSVERYIRSLKDRDFREIDQFLKAESIKYNLISGALTKTRVGQVLEQGPPTLPDYQSSRLMKLFWTLKLHYWVWRHAPDEQDEEYLIRMFVNFQEPSRSEQLLHSVGVQNALVGVVNVLGVRSQHRQNNIIITHELLHTVGASDKYDRNGRPIAPDGLANPQKRPLYPQAKAEIMAGRRAISAQQAELPRSLRKIVVGEKTAGEIGWIKNP